MKFIIKRLINLVLIISFYINPPSLHLKLLGLVRIGFFFNLKSPRTFNEKINRRKLSYISNPDSLIAKCANKYLSREYVSSRGYSSILTKVYSCSENIYDLDFSKCPSQYYLKSSRGSGGLSVNYINNIQLTYDHLQQIYWSCRRPYGKEKYENWYQDTETLFYTEEAIPHGPETKEYKIYCFNGLERSRYIIRLIENRYTDKSNLFYDEDWNPIMIGYNKVKISTPVSRPKILNELLDISKNLSSSFDHVRIDFIVRNNLIYFGEFTFADSSGYIEFNEKKWDLFMGNLWEFKEVT